MFGVDGIAGGEGEEQEEQVDDHFVITARQREANRREFHRMVTRE